jgi:hypothetical protein
MARRVPMRIPFKRTESAFKRISISEKLVLAKAGIGNYDIFLAFFDLPETL